jgi:site-specific DNA-methyltransferase (adenine-specific)
MASRQDEEGAVNYARMPKDVRDRLQPAAAARPVTNPLRPGRVYAGDARALLPRIAPASVALSFWSPPYFVGKSYEAHLTFGEWQGLLRAVIALHAPILRPGGFLAVNIADILCFRDGTMPRVQAHSVTRHRSPVTRADVLRAAADHPEMNRYALARLLGCSEQTLDRRLNGNNIRGGKYDTQTRVKIVGGLVEEWALAADLYPYDRRVWVKDPAWENSKWHTLSYRAVDEFEYLYVFWKPGVTVVDRSRLTSEEWREWGSRGVWMIPSVRVNDDHEAKFPIELPRRAIRLLTSKGDVVLDCFMGSGTTGVAARLEGRTYIGIEKDPEYARLARQRIAEEGERSEARYVSGPKGTGKRSGPRRGNRKGVVAIRQPRLI